MPAASSEARGHLAALDALDRDSARLDLLDDMNDLEYYGGVKTRGGVLALVAGLTFLVVALRRGCFSPMTDPIDSCRLIAAVLALFVGGCGNGKGNDGSSSGSRQTSDAVNELKTMSISFTNGAKMEFVLIPPGEFAMGSMAREDEMPIRHVSISQAFWLGRTEVTQAQWMSVMDTFPSSFIGGNLPVEQVSWDNAVSFCRMLSRGLDSLDIRLPTEAEWEYACRAGSTGEFCFG
ncbi:MAG: formylglycine-generating enzyme family protein, partial [Phycisphaerae bacterium]|nr:formylglycine-generating enzyme family protein [Phycisphaerae bacterium]